MKIWYEVLISVLLVFLLFMISYFFINKYASESIPKLFKILWIYTWFITFCVFILFHVDVFLSLKNEIISLTTFWKFFYWNSFILSWVVFAIFDEYKENTPLNFNSIINLLKIRLKKLIIILIIGIVVLVILLLKNIIQFSELFTLAKAFSNGFGLLIIVIILGLNLVAIPKSFFLSSNLDKHLEQKYSKINNIHDNHLESFYNIEFNIKLFFIWKRKKMVESDNLIIKEVEDLLKDIKHLFDFEALNTNNDDEDINQLIANFSITDLKYNIQDFKRLDYLLNNTIEETKNLFLIKNVINKKNEFLEYNNWVKFPSYKIIYYKYLRQNIYLLISAVLLFLSLVIFILENLSFLNINIFEYKFISNLLKGSSFQIFFTIPYLYIIFLTYQGIIKFKIGESYGLYNGKNTPLFTLVFYTKNMSRITTPLCYNFMMMFGIEKTNFNDIIKNSHNLFGTKIMYVYFAILVFLVITGYKGYGKRILNFIGFGIHSNSDKKEIKKGYDILLEKLKNN